MIGPLDPLDQWVENTWVSQSILDQWTGCDQLVKQAGQPSLPPTVLHTALYSFCHPLATYLKAYRRPIENAVTTRPPFSKLEHHLPPNMADFDTSTTELLLCLTIMLWTTWSLHMTSRNPNPIPGEGEKRKVSVVERSHARYFLTATMQVCVPRLKA